MNTVIINIDSSIINFKWCSGAKLEDSYINFYNTSGELFHTVKYKDPEYAQTDIEYIHRAVGNKAWYINLIRREYRI